VSNYVYRYTGENKWAVGIYGLDGTFQTKTICHTVEDADRQTNYLNGRCGVAGGHSSGYAVSGGGGAPPMGRSSTIWHTIKGCTCSGANGLGICNCKTKRDFTLSELQLLSDSVFDAMAFANFKHNPINNDLVALRGKILNMIEDHHD